MQMSALKSVETSLGIAKDLGNVNVFINGIRFAN